MSQNRDLRSLMYEREAYGDERGGMPAPTRRRRSQPSLDVHPYGQRPSAAAGHGMTSASGMSGPYQGILSGGISVKTEPDVHSYRSYSQATQSVPYVQFRPMSVEDMRATMSPIHAGFGPQFAMTNYWNTPVALIHDSQLPTAAEFDDLLNEYISSLSEKKRDKALIGQTRYNNIFAVLKDPKCTTIESAQFRFWAKKMFVLELLDNGQQVVLHEGKPVAVREHLFDILTQAHVSCQHGGRDKTSSQVRKFYSWVPKELIARFVRGCPSCRARRSPGDRRTPPSSSSRSTPASSAGGYEFSSPLSSPQTEPVHQVIATAGSSAPQALHQLAAHAGQAGNAQMYHFQPVLNTSVPPQHGQFVTAPMEHEYGYRNA